MERNNWCINMQINRLFDIIYTLLHKERVTAGELAERFGVSTRTIYCDIDILSVAGIPVYSEKGRGGGISLLPDFVLSKSMLNEQEQNEILAALHGLEGIKPVKAGQVLDKMSSIFNRPAANWLEVDFSDWTWANTTFDDFKAAVLQRRVAEFDYFNRYGEKTFRRIEPVQLWFKSRAWYIRGYCLTKQGPRLYKLSRVKNLVVTGQSFAERDWAEELESLEADDWEQYTSFKLRIAPEMVYRAYDEFNENMMERQDDGSVIVTVAWTEDSWVYGFILSFGEHIEVLEPEHVRKIIKNKAQKISEKYL
jgi:predicted DNA-binding transcriptional regulator YafY